MNNEIKINVPEGMEIDRENSTLECIKFKPKWIPKRGDIAAAGDNHSQIILVGKYIKPSNIVGFDIKCLAVLDRESKILDLREDFCNNNFWVLEEASALEKKLFIEKLNKQGYVYDPNDPRVIYKKEKELPKTWEEFCINNPVTQKEYFIRQNSTIVSIEDCCRDTDVDSNLFPSREYAEAMLALCKLIQLRDCYNDGWKANWLNGDETKYTIIYYEGKVLKGKKYYESTLLNFKTESLRENFYINFKDLIEQAKPLL